MRGSATARKGTTEPGGASAAGRRDIEPVCVMVARRELESSLSAFEAELVALRIRHHDPSSRGGTSTVIDDLGSKRLKPGYLVTLAAVCRHDIEMDTVLRRLGFEHRDEHQARSIAVGVADKPERVPRNLFLRPRPPGDLAPKPCLRLGIGRVEGRVEDRAAHGSADLGGVIAERSIARQVRVRRMTADTSKRRHAKSAFGPPATPFGRSPKARFCLPPTHRVGRLLGRHRLNTQLGHL